MLVYPASGDVSGQVVIDAQAVGAPAVVGDAGAGREFVDDGVTGIVLPASDPAAWAGAICGLLDDEPRRQRMSRNAVQRTRRLTPGKDVEQLWAQCLAAIRQQDGDPQEAPEPIVAVAEAPEVVR
jgi:glycosyltransferase involved in cell wall biosynthesis